MSLVLRAALSSGLYQRTGESGPQTSAIKFDGERRYEIRWGSRPDRALIGECLIHDPEDGVDLEIEWLDVDSLPYAIDDLQVQPVFTIEGDGTADLQFVNVYTPPGRASNGTDFFDSTP